MLLSGLENLQLNLPTQISKMSWELWVLFAAPIVTLLFIIFVVFFVKPFEEEKFEDE